MKKLLLIFTLFTQVITATNCEDLENAITKSDKDSVVRLLQNNHQLKKMEVVRLIDLAQQIILTRKSDQECFRMNPNGYGLNRKEKRMCKMSLTAFAISLVSGMVAATYKDPEIPAVTCMATSFLSFTASVFLVFCSLEMSIRRWSRELQKLLDDSISIKLLLWKYYNFLQEA